MPSELKNFTKHTIHMTRAYDGSPHEFVGYAALWHNPEDPGTTYQMGKNVIERIKRTAFDNILTKNPNVELRYNHSKDHVLANTKTGTLFLSVDNKGLRFSAPYDANDPDHVKTATKIQKGIAQGCSFDVAAECSSVVSNGSIIRTVENVFEFTEISIVNHPAYKSPYAMVRSEDGKVEALLERNLQVMQKLKNRELIEKIKQLTKGAA